MPSFYHPPQTKPHFLNKPIPLAQLQHIILLCKPYQLTPPIH